MLKLVGTQTVQEAKAHQQLRETQIEVASRAVGLLDWLLQSIPDRDIKSLVDLDEAIARIERVRAGLL
jgi:hypothetical protein